MADGGFWAWVTYFFAGTRFALPICIAIVTGGVAMLVAWISKKYDCPVCKNNQWIAIDDEAVEKLKLAQRKIQELNAENTKYKSEIKQLSDELSQRKIDFQEYIKITFQNNIIVNTQNTHNDEYVKQLENDIDFLIEQWESQESRILAVLAIKTPKKKTLPF